MKANGILIRPKKRAFTGEKPKNGEPLHRLISRALKQGEPIRLDPSDGIYGDDVEPLCDIRTDKWEALRNTAINEGINAANAQARDAGKSEIVEAGKSTKSDA